MPHFCKQSHSFFRVAGAQVRKGKWDRNSMPTDKKSRANALSSALNDKRKTALQAVRCSFPYGKADAARVSGLDNSFTNGVAYQFSA